MKRLRAGRVGAALHSVPRPSLDAPLVLYVEDDVDNWSVAQLHLRERFRLVWAKTDAEACTVIRDLGPQLAAVLLDIELKDSKLSGLELARVFRGQTLGSELPGYARNLPPLASPIFFLTAYSTRYKESDATIAGGDRLLYKPVNFGELSLALSASQLRDVSPAMLRLLEALRVGSPGALAAVETAEPHLVARWMLLASAFPHHGLAFTGLAAAVAQVGSDVATQLALALAVVEMTPARPAAAVLLANVLRRGVAAALVAEQLGEHPPAQAFATGLLLEGGLAARALHDLEGTLEVCRGLAADRPLREKGAGEIEHPARGAEMLRSLAAEGSLIEAVAAHHDRALPSAPLARLAWLAERFAGVHETGSHARMLDETIAAAEKAALPRDQVLRIVEAIPEHVARVAHRLGRELPAQPSLAALLQESTPSLLALDESYSALVRRLSALVAEKDALVRRLSQARDAIAARAATDELTGIANTRAFFAAGRRECALAKRKEVPTALVLLDIDHFKRINDTFGHPTGDAVLKHLGQLLTSGLRTGDIAARYGGEEFGLLLPQTEPEGASALAERMRATLEGTPVRLGDVEIPVTASFGVACFTGEAGVSFEDLVRAADTALYAAKAAGRNRVHLAPMLP